MGIEAIFLSHLELAPFGYGGSPCILWTAALADNGYGQWSEGRRDDKRSVRAHRWAYEHWVGPIPEGYTADHLCHNADRSCLGGDTCPHRRCANPLHLEPVPILINIRRSHRHNANKQGCPHGHPYDEANTYVTPVGLRTCRTCRRERNYRARAKRLELTGSKWR